MLLIAIEPGPSPIHGFGLFAAEPVPAGKIVWQFDPGIDHRHPIGWLDGQPAHVRRHVAMYAVRSLDRAYYYVLGDHTFLINHSFTPNLAPRDDLLVNDEGVVVAARDIAAGEELTVNYATIDGSDRERLTQGMPLFPPESHVQA